MTGFVLLHRSFIEWEWYDDINVMRLFLHLILKANHKGQKWRGIEIRRGQLLTSLSKLSKETGLTIKQIRNAITKLKTTGELASKTTSQYTILTLENYSKYQDSKKERAVKEAIKKASKGQARGKQGATNNNVNNEKNVNNNNADASDDFENFWNVYDKKQDRAKCEKKWKILTFNEKQKIFEVLQDYVTSTPDKKFRKNPLTWLNGKNWNDEIQSNQPEKTEFQKAVERGKELGIEWQGYTVHTQEQFISQVNDATQ